MYELVCPHGKRCVHNRAKYGACPCGSPLVAGGYCALNQQLIRGGNRWDDRCEIYVPQDPFGWKRPETDDDISRDIDLIMSQTAFDITRTEVASIYEELNRDFVNVITHLNNRQQ